MAEKADPGADRGIPGGGYIGKVLSIITTAEMRYEGLLRCVDVVHNTLTLVNVRCFGTEGRLAGEFSVDGSNDVYATVEFKAADIKELEVKLPPNMPHHSPLAEVGGIVANDPEADSNTAFGTEHAVLATGGPVAPITSGAPPIAAPISVAEIVDDHEKITSAAGSENFAAKSDPGEMKVEVKQEPPDDASDEPTPEGDREDLKEDEAEDEQPEEEEESNDLGWDEPLVPKKEAKNADEKKEVEKADEKEELQPTDGWGEPPKAVSAAKEESADDGGWNIPVGTSGGSKHTEKKEAVNVFNENPFGRGQPAVTNRSYGNNRQENRGGGSHHMQNNAAVFNENPFGRQAIVDNRTDVRDFQQYNRGGPPRGGRGGNFGGRGGRDARGDDGVSPFRGGGSGMHQPDAGAVFRPGNQFGGPATRVGALDSCPPFQRGGITNRGGPSFVRGQNARGAGGEVARGGGRRYSAGSEEAFDRGAATGPSRGGGGPPSVFAPPRASGGSENIADTRSPFAHGAVVGGPGRGIMPSRGGGGRGAPGGNAPSRGRVFAPPQRIAAADTGLKSGAPGGGPVAADYDFFESETAKFQVQFHRGDKNAAEADKALMDLLCKDKKTEKPRQNAAAAKASLAAIPEAIESKKCYDKTKSFFDTISTDAEEHENAFKRRMANPRVFGMARGGGRRPPMFRRGGGPGGMGRGGPPPPFRSVCAASYQRGRGGIFAPGGYIRRGNIYFIH